MDDILKIGYHKSPLGYNSVDGFVDEVLKFENQMVFYSKNSKKDNIMTEENEEGYRTDKVCRFCEKEIFSDKVRDHCHLTAEYRSPAHNSCNINGTQKQSNLIPFRFHNFNNYDCHRFF